jgi:hypothetical protein
MTMTNRRTLLLILVTATLAPFLMGAQADDGCNGSPAVSASGISKATVKIPTGPDGLTAEQRNIADRLQKDNEVGAIKHLYVISAYSGQVLIYSTVKGKVTSGGKRLTPTTVVAGVHSSGYQGGFAVNIGDARMTTAEVLQDDGTYGSSTDYLYWWDTNGVYHQHYVQGGQIVHVSDQPLSVPGVVINMQVVGDGAPAVKAPLVEEPKKAKP